MAEHPQEYLDLFRSIPSPLVTVSPDAAVVFATRAAEDLLGLDAHAHRQPVPHWLASRLADAPVTFQRQIHTPGGDRVVSVTIHRVDRGVHAGFVIALEDLTAFAAAEEEARRARDLALDALRVRDDFMHLVTHELRTPITAIAGYAQMLERLAEDGALGALADAPSRILERTAHMDRLVGELLRSARAEGGTVDLETRCVDTREFLRSCVSRLPRGDRHPIAMEVDEAAARLVCDPDRLEFAVVNVVQNAVKYSPRGGTVSVSAHRIGREIVLRVADEGIGMRAEDISRSFARFERIADPDTEDVGGFGVGLYIAKRVVEAHCGRIDVASERGVGTTFSIRLPQPLAESETPQASACEGDPPTERSA